MDKRGILKAAGIVSVATILVRIAGLSREMVSAYFFGTTLVYDAFLLAFMIPNFFRGILGEGALNSAFIPVFSNYLKPEDKPKAQKIIQDTVGASLIFTLTLSILFYFAANIGLFFNLSEKVMLTLSFLRFTIFYLVFISLAALVMGVLNSLGHFAAPALAPLGLDLFWIFSLVCISPLFGSGLVGRTHGLIIGLLLGGAAQFLIPLPNLRRSGFSLKPSFDLKNPALVRMGQLLLPVIVGMAVTPINLLVDYFLASVIAPGMVSSLWYAIRIMQLPLGVFAVTMGTVALPSLAKLASAGEWPEMKKTLFFSLKSTLFLIIPASLGLMVFREPIIRLLFERGLFTSQSTAATGGPLLFYSLGLFAYSGNIILTRAFYALEDTRTPVIIGLWSILLNFLLDIILMIPLRQSGIALSTTLVGIINFTLLFLFLRRKIGVLGGRQMVNDVWKIIFFSCLAVLTALSYFNFLQPYLKLLYAFACAAAAGCAVYFGAEYVRRQGKI